MIDNKKVSAIILVAGNSTRFGTGKNKNFELINNKAILEYSIEEFNNNNYIDDIIIVAKEEEFSIINNIIQKEKFEKNINIILGGNSRKQSVYNSIKNIESDIVIIHDGARPCIKQEYIDKCIESMKEFKGATIGVKTKDTIKIADENNVVKSTTKRDNTWLVQTPQCFDRKILLNMHKKYVEQDMTDDCMLLENNNYKVKIIEGNYSNIKVTTYEDLDIVKLFLK